MLLATVVMAVAAFVVADEVVQATDPGKGRTLWTYGALVAALASVSGSYIIAAWTLRIPELRQLIEVMRRRLHSTSS